MYRSYIYLVKFISKYFMVLFYYKWYFCQFHFFNCSMQSYRNSTDYCILSLYPTILLNSLIISSNLGFAIHKTMSSENKDYFTLAFPIRMYFISFSGLNVLTRIYSTILTAIGQSEKTTLFFPILCGKHYLYY